MVKKIMRVVSTMLIFALWFGGCKCQVETGNLTPVSKKKSDERKVSSEALGISNIVFCSESPAGYMDYKEKPNAVYKPGETVWVYCNLDGVKYNLNQDGTREIWIKVDLKVLTPEGKIYLDQEILNEHKNFGKEFDVDNLFLRININTIPDMPEGKYTVRLNLMDKLANKQAFASSVFTLKH